MKQNDKGSNSGLEKLDDMGLWEVPGCSHRLSSDLILSTCSSMPYF